MSHHFRRTYVSKTFSISKENIFIATTTAIITLAICPEISRAANPDFSTEAYSNVISNIRNNGFDKPGGLPQLFNFEPVTVNPNGTVTMVYNFGYNDSYFGQQGVAVPLISSTTSLKCKLEDGNFYPLHLIKDKEEWDQKETKIPFGTPELNTYNLLPWLSEAAPKLNYLTDAERKNQWSLTDTSGAYISPCDDNPLNPYRRVAISNGMDYDPLQDTQGRYANNYVLTLEVEPKYLFRPNANQLVSDTTAQAAPMMKDAEGHYQYDQTDWPISWRTSDSTVIPRIFSSNKNKEDRKAYGHLSDFLNNWWNGSFNPESSAQTNPFPWTGIGYVYDWYYQDPNEWADGKGNGGAEYILMQSTTDYDVNITIKNVQTTAQWLGATEQFPGVPEPDTLVLALLGLAFLPRQRRR